MSPAFTQNNLPLNTDLPDQSPARKLPPLEAA